MVSGWRSILLACVAAAALGCLSPTLPLPPPGEPSQSASADPNKVHLHGMTGDVPAGSTILVYNKYANPSENLGDDQMVTATLAHADGSWDADIFAIKGDTVTIYDVDENEWSPSTTVTIK